MKKYLISRIICRYRFCCIKKEKKDIPVSTQNYWILLMCVFGFPLLVCRNGVNINRSVFMFKNKLEKKLLLIQGCSWTESLLVSNACTLLIRAPEILKPWSHQYPCKQIIGEFRYSREYQCLLASEVFGNTLRL